MKDLMKHIYVLAVFLTAAIPASPAKQQESIRWSGNEKVKVCVLRRIYHCLMTPMLLLVPTTG